MAAHLHRRLAARANKAHGYNFLPHLTGQEEKGPRKEIFYFSDTGDLTALRYNDWKAILQPVTFASMPAAAQDRAALDNDVHAAITLLLQTSPAAKRLASSARGALVFPNIVKAGFLVGVQYGNGALVRRRQGGGYYIASYYNIKSASYGLML